MARDLPQPHDSLFRKVFSRPAAAVGFLRAYVPQWLAATLDWDSLTLMPGSYVDDKLRTSQSDLLYTIEQREDAATPAAEARRLGLYLLLEHQSKPDRWMRFRLLKYCCRIWDDVLSADEKGEVRHLPPIVPVVFYQGETRWQHAREFSELFAEAVRRWPWTPQLEHVLVDHSRAEPGDVQGEPQGRATQLAMMATARKKVREAALRLVLRNIGAMHRAGQDELFDPVLRYLARTQDRETTEEFGKELRRVVPGPGGEMKTYADELIQEGLEEGLRKGREEGRQEGRDEGRQEGQVAMIEGFLGAGIEWPTIERATGIDQAAFDALRRQMRSSDREA